MAAGLTQEQLDAHIQQMIAASVGALRTDTQVQITQVNADIVTATNKLATRIEEVSDYANTLSEIINGNREAISARIVEADQY